jgi:hypothetical protein
MRHDKLLIRFISLVALMVLLGTASEISAQKRPRTFFSERQGAHAALANGHNPDRDVVCKGEISGVVDVGFEGLKRTSFNWSNTTGGGESGRYDKTPVLSTTVNLERGCLDAHFSALVGSKQSYPSASRITMFQVTLTPAGGAGGPRHMIGHYENPYGTYGPAVALEPERDVDMFAANFFQGIGRGQEEVPPGTYRVDVWWSGGPVGGGGAIGGAFVLKLYLRQ